MRRPISRGPRQHRQPRIKSLSEYRAERRRRLWLQAAAVFVGVFLVGMFVTRGIPSLTTHLSATGSGGFALCSFMRRDACVVDGDTFYWQGDKIRIADIDTPETHPPRCSLEAELGARATIRLLAMLNEGPFELQSLSGRDHDKYGRSLRIVTRDGRSIGDRLVAEGVARTWTGHREPWC